jgi:hypothetical protein
MTQIPFRSPLAATANCNLQTDNSGAAKHPARLAGKLIREPLPRLGRELVQEPTRKLTSKHNSKLGEKRA